MVKWEFYVLRRRAVVCMSDLMDAFDDIGKSGYELVSVCWHDEQTVTAAFQRPMFPPVDNEQARDKFIPEVGMLTREAIQADVVYWGFDSDGNPTLLYRKSGK